MLPFVLFVAMLNGLATPLLPLVLSYAPLWLPGILPDNFQLLLYVSMLMCSTLTLLLGGIPAAIYERITKAKESSPTALTIWGAGVLLLTLPSVPNLVKLVPVFITS